jgi:hypothetical protein
LFVVLVDEADRRDADPLVDAQVLALVITANWETSFSDGEIS